MNAENVSRMQVKILLIDDHAILRQGLHLLLDRQDDFIIVGEANEGEAGIALIPEVLPDIIIMDISMPGLNGIEATKRITAKFPNTKVIALSIHSEKTFVEDMLRAGAAGYILKESVPEDLVRGIREVVNGAGYLSPSITGHVVSGYRDSSSPEPYDQEKKREIIETKLYIPELPEDHIDRPRLMGPLEKNRNLSLQTVTAPAGYGKTTLVSSWLSEIDISHAWISLDERDNDLRQFVAYITHAVQSLFPGSLPKSVSRLEADILPPVSVLATGLVNEISIINQDFILVVDDFHFITEKDISDLLTEILRHPPKSLHLVIVGRTEPFLPLGKLRAQALLSEIRLQDLRFTDDETASYLQRVLTSHFDVTKSRHLNEKTEGWITGIRLAALAIIDWDDQSSLFEELLQSGQHVMDYLVHEVLLSQPRELHKQLVCASILKRFCPPLLDVIFEQDGSDRDVTDFDKEGGLKFIERLKKSQLFLIPLDTEGHWYRFHHLFHGLLEKERQHHFSPEEITALNSKASRWFTENDFIEEAIAHALTAGDTTGAVGLVEKNRHIFHNNDQCYALENWLSLFPEEVISKSPELLVARLWILYHHFDIPAIPAIVDAIEQEIRHNSVNLKLEGELLFFKGYLLYLKNDGSGSLRYLQEAVDKIPERHGEVRGQAELLYGLAHQMLGNEDQAVLRLQDILSKDQGDRSAWKTRLLVTFVYFHILSGNLPAARVANRQLYDFSSSGNFLYAKAWSLYLDGLICFYQYDLDEAIVCFRQAIEDRSFFHTRAAVDSLAGLILAYQAKNQPELLQTAMEELKDLVSGLRNPVNKTVVQFFETRLSILQQGGQIAKGKWHRQDASAADNMVWWLETPQLSYCRALLAANNHMSLEEAEARLQAILRQNEACHNMCQVIQTMVLLACAHKKLGKLEEALAVLRKAVGLAETGRWIWPFIEPGLPIKNMLLRLPEPEASSPFTKQIIDIFKDLSATTVAAESQLDRNTKPHSDSPSQLTSLTLREKEILELLVQGHANKEIAEKLFVSIDTVKTHLRNIYNKLEVKSRLQAVAMAQSFDLGDQMDQEAD